MKVDKDYLIRKEVMIVTNCLPILGMITGCPTSDLAMLRWIAYIKSMNPKFCHIWRKNNVMADMLSRAKYEDECDMVSEDEDVALEFFIEERGVQVLNAFNESEYEGE
mgnify:CR=1 FL=1